MFVEVYAIPLIKYSEEDTGVSKKPENLRLVELTGSRIRPSLDYEDRCEIVTPNTTLICAGSYAEVSERVASACWVPRVD